MDNHERYVEGSERENTDADKSWQRSQASRRRSQERVPARVARAKGRLQVKIEAQEALTLTDELSE